MSLTYFLDCFIRRLSVCTSRACARPSGLDGILIRRFLQIAGASASHKGAQQRPFLPHPLPHRKDILLTPSTITLQSP